MHTRRFGALAGALAAGMALANSLPAQQADSVTADSSAVRPACSTCIQPPRLGLDLYADGTIRDTTRRRAIEYSDAYGTRLAIHRIGSYVELPLFATEYVLGQKLLNEEAAGPLPRGSSLKSAHSLVAGGLGVLFAVNTVTGVWNLIEARHDPAGRTRRWLHSLMMLAADGGFALTASAGGPARRTLTGANTHRNLAIASMSLATVSTLMMWLWKN